MSVLFVPDRSHRGNGTGFRPSPRSHRGNKEKASLFFLPPARIAIKRRQLHAARFAVTDMPEGVHVKIVAIFAVVVVLTLIIIINAIVI